jgi:hypothetical protein
MEASMTALENIEDHLRRNLGSAYCDDCLSDILNIRPRQQVQQKTSSLAKDNRFWRGLRRCARCGEDNKLVICVRLAMVG